MGRKRFELGVPMGIDRSIDFETAADPIEKFLLAFLDGGFGGVMNTRKADTFFHQCAEFFEMIVLQSGMSTTAIRIDDNRIGTVKRVGSRRPAIAINDGAVTRNFINTRFEQQTSRPMLVLTRAMTKRPGNENNLFVRGRGDRQSSHAQNNCQKNFFHTERSGIQANYLV